ncbi:hypothetical protein [Nocardiopsis rhodophaea]|uniref:hypothetical protein n=1 Tax=Nocardiopsis rhodophaea TaxID=280238 RepID=UPI0031E3449D
MASWKSRIALASAISSLSACGFGNPVADLDQGEADEKVEEYITESLSTLPEGAKLETVDGMRDSSCGDTENDNSGHVVRYKKYRILGLPAEDKEQNAESVLEYWKQRGYSLITDSRPERLMIRVETPDSFEIALRGDRGDDLTISAVSPCFSPYEDE